jgi:hypothetical protein
MCVRNIPHDFEMYLELVARLRESVTQVHSPVRVCIEDILEEIDSTDHAYEQECDAHEC